MSIEHTTRAITENKYLMQLFADKKSLEADIAALNSLKGSNPSDTRASDYNIKQKEYELSQIESRTKGKDYSSVKDQCEKYFTDNTSLFDKNQIIAETRSMLAKGQIVNEWPHLAAVFLLDHAVVTDTAKAGLAAVTKTTPVAEKIYTPESVVSPAENTPEPIHRPVETGIPQTPKTPAENLPPIFTTKETMVFKDGAYYLTGPKGNTKRVDMQSLLVNLNLPKDAPENLQKSVSFVQDFALILDGYLLKNPDKKEQYNATLKGIQIDFASMDVQSGKTILDIKKWTPTLFSNNNLFKNSDLYTINQALNIKEPKARKLAILSFIRSSLGQSDFVAQKLMESTDIGMPLDAELIANKGDIGSNVEHRKKIADAIRHAETEAAQDWEKNHAEYEERFKKMNPGATWKPSEAQENNKKIRMIFAGRKEFAYQELYNKNDLSGNKALLQDILGAGSMKMSDRSWEISKEVGGMIAMEAIAIAAGVITAGVGTAAINTLAFGRNAYKGAKALEAYNAASKTKQALTTTARIIGGGAAFEAGGATTRSLLENGDLASMHSKEGYAQSIAMMGVLGGIGKLISAGKLGTGIQFKEGAVFTKNILPFLGQVAIEGSAIFGTSATIGSVFFDRRDNWTPEQMAQAMLMATMFKGAGRVFASKNPKGEIEVKKPTEEVISHEKKDVIPEWTFKSEPAKPSENIVDISKFTTREITTTDVRRTKNLIKNSHYPQFIAEDGTIWSMRSVTGKSGSEMVEIGPLGAASVTRKATIQEFVDGVNANVRKFKNNGSTATSNNISVESLSQRSAFLEDQVMAGPNSIYNQTLSAHGKYVNIRGTNDRFQIRFNEGNGTFTFKDINTGHEYIDIQRNNIPTVLNDMYNIVHQNSNGTPKLATSKNQIEVPPAKIENIESPALMDAKVQPKNTLDKPVVTPKTENKTEQASKPGLEKNHQSVPHIDPITAKNAIHKAENATIDHMVTPAEKQNFIAKYGAEKWAALSQSFKDAPKGIGAGANSIFGVVTGIGRSTVSWKGATIGTGITEVIEAYFNVNGKERDWNPMTDDGIKNIGGMLWQILAYRYMGFVRGFIVTEGYRVIPAVYTQVRDANK